MRHASILGVILIAIGGCGATPGRDIAAAGVNLAELDGWDIVVADDAIASEVYAAEEFQEFLHRAGGVKLPIVCKIQRADRHVFVGPGKLMQASEVGFSVEDLGPEDLHIVVGDDHIAIAGGRPRGTLYGVYTFLEDYLGVRFLTHDHTHVPALGPQPVIGRLDRVYRPPFANHRQADYRGTGVHPVFAARHRINASHHWFPGHDEPRFGGLSPFLLINHSFYQQVPLDPYGKTHPEYFALVDGKRNTVWMSQRCLTNPGVLRITIQAVRDQLDARPEIRNVAVGQNDGFDDYCHCENCAAIDEREESHMGATLAFVNKVADEIAKTHPDVFVGTLAYTYSRKLPRNIRPRDNVQVMFCSASACHIHAFADGSCPQNVALMRDLADWSKACKQLYAWTYNVYFRAPPLPYPNLHTIRPNIKTLQDHGFLGVFMQCAGKSAATELSDLRNYLICRLMWNPDLDDKAIINEFLELHYREAARPIRKFINMIHKHYADAGTHSDPLAYHGWELPVDEDVAQAGLALFQDAMKLAEDDVVRARVEKASICAYAAAIDPIWRLKEDAVVDPALAEQMRPLAREFFRLCDEHQVGERKARERIEGLLAKQVIRDHAD